MLPLFEKMMIGSGHNLANVMTAEPPGDMCKFITWMDHWIPNYSKDNFDRNPYVSSEETFGAVGSQC